MPAFRRGFEIRTRPDGTRIVWDLGRRHEARGGKAREFLTQRPELVAPELRLAPIRGKRAQQRAKQEPRELPEVAEDECGGWLAGPRWEDPGFPYDEITRAFAGFLQCKEVRYGDGRLVVGLDLQALLVLEAEEDEEPDEDENEDEEPDEIKHYREKGDGGDLLPLTGFAPADGRSRRLLTGEEYWNLGGSFAGALATITDQRAPGAQAHSLKRKAYSMHGGKLIEREHAYRPRKVKPKKGKKGIRKGRRRK